MDNYLKWYLYVFAGFPGRGSGIGTEFLNPRGIARCMTVEELGILETNENIQCRKAGIFIAGTEELLGPTEYRMSDMLLQQGITWDWFDDNNWFFGNGITMYMSAASPEYKSVVYGTDLSMDEFLTAQKEPVAFSDIRLHRKQVAVESWKGYEARWLPGTCPQETHGVHLTWVVTKEPLVETAYKRLQQIIEERAVPDDLNSYSSNHFSPITEFTGKSIHYADPPL